jgi:hypothetical protein
MSAAVTRHPHASALPALSIAVLGAGGQALAQAVAHSLSALPGTSPVSPLHWQFPANAQESTGAQLRWLLAWDEGAFEGQEPAQAIAALQAHQALRQSLHALGLAYQVLRGTPQAQQMQALQTLLPWLPELASVLPQTGVESRRPGWRCSDCSDPGCEHRSFTELLAQRAQS